MSTDKFEPPPELAEHLIRFDAAKAILSPEAIHEISEGMRPRVAELLRRIADKLAPATIKSPNNTVKDKPEVVAENHLARFETQYRGLPKENILYKDSTWEKVKARLTAEENKDKLRKVMGELQNDGRLYAVMEDGTCEFMDGNSETPPMFLKNKKTEQFNIIFNCDDKKMEKAGKQVRKGTHEWASIQEMLDWAETNGFGVFEADTEDMSGYGKHMKLAGASEHPGLFANENLWSGLGTALKDGYLAYFDPRARGIRININDNPNPESRCYNTGLLRRLSI
jgi:hypothetical protein